eukprot:6016694-Pyramimonas_sp.AAC.1
MSGQALSFLEGGKPLHSRFRTTRPAWVQARGPNSSTGQRSRREAGLEVAQAPHAPHKINGGLAPQRMG